MALAPCNTFVDSSNRELVKHGTIEFPIACYHDDLSKDEVPWHWHEELEAAIITEGSAIVRIGKNEYTIQPGEGFFINSGVLHGAWINNSSSCRFHSMVFHHRLVGGSTDSIFFQKYVRPIIDNRSFEGMCLSPDVPWQNDILEAIEQTWQNCIIEPIGYEFSMRNSLSKVILMLQTYLPSGKLRYNEKELRDGNRIKIMLQFIHDHFYQKVSMNDIAQSASLSESECLRCFKSTIGTTPIHYLRQYRIQQASQMLVSSDEKIADISAECGFQDVSYFTKIFRETKGITPAEFKKRYQ